MGIHMRPELMHRGSAIMQAPQKTGKQSWGLCPLLIGRMRPSQKGRVSFHLGARSPVVTPAPDLVWAQPPPVGTGHWAQRGEDTCRRPAAPQEG